MIPRRQSSHTINQIQKMRINKTATVALMLLGLSATTVLADQPAEQSKAESQGQASNKTAIAVFNDAIDSIGILNEQLDAIKDAESAAQAAQQIGPVVEKLNALCNQTLQGPDSDEEYMQTMLLVQKLISLQNKVVNNVNRLYEAGLMTAELQQALQIPPQQQPAEEDNE